MGYQKVYFAFYPRVFSLWFHPSGNKGGVRFCNYWVSIKEIKKAPRINKGLSKRFKPVLYF